MAQVDHRRRLPSPAFFSREALPLLHGAMGEQVRQDAVGRGRPRPPHRFRGGPGRGRGLRGWHCPLWGDAAGWPAGGAGEPEEAGHAWVRGLPLGRAAEDEPRGLRGQLSLWLGHGFLRLGFLVSGGCPSLEQAVRTEGCTHAPCVAHCLDSLVGDFLCHRHSVQIILGTAGAIRSHFQGSAEARRLLPAPQPFLGLSDPWCPPATCWSGWWNGSGCCGGARRGSSRGGRGGPVGRAVKPGGRSGQLPQPFWMVVREASTHGPP
ncbi:leucine-rich repeat-containing protein 61 isoform X1 [Balaenoptera ricei]|uniref:leucine-rich repeat-containing protein 61 isoform X1 n=1 Tax=Balaenoptera ricei TaxID=2746895 RepID=UPI0028BE3A8F|nr:leucine-rich repeat-containing protein 61 isoform X1 [Balaenoptera ricei]